MTQTNEHAFESYCEQMLLTQGGWERGDLAEWDRGLALFPARVCAFLADSQPVLWQKLHDLHGDALGPRVVAALAKELDLKGMLHVLRRGFKFHGKTLRMAYFKPAHGLNATVVELFGKNRLTVTRQLPCHAKGGETLDMLLALNGLPIGSCELKKPGTGQTWRHAVKQYREDRDPNAPLFQF